MKAFKYPFFSPARQLLLSVLGIAVLAGTFAQANAQAFNIQEFDSTGHEVYGNIVSATDGNCTDPLPLGKECTSVLRYTTPHFGILATYHAQNQDVGAVVEVTATVTKLKDSVGLTDFVGSLGLGPALNFELSGGAPISAVGWLSGSCRGAGYTSQIDAGLSLQGKVSSGQVDALCPYFLSSTKTTNQFITGLNAYIPPQPYKTWKAVTLYSPEAGMGFALGSIAGATESYVLVSKFGPASYLVP